MITILKKYNFIDEVWYRTKDCKFHNVNEAAIKTFDGKEYWYINDKLYRLYGPAIIDDLNQYIIDGDDISNLKNLLYLFGVLN